MSMSSPARQAAWLWAPLFLILLSVIALNTLFQQSTTAQDQTQAMPVANAGPDQAADVGALVILDGSLSYHPGGEALSYTWSVQSAPVAVTLSQTDSLRPQLTLAVPGDYQLQLTVSDGNGLSHSDSVLISTGNVPPVAAAGLDRVAAVGEQVIVDASASTDANGDRLSYQWQLIEQPAGSLALLSDATALRPQITLDVAGDYVLELVVSDSQGALSEADRLVISSQNLPPLAEAGPAQQVSIGEVVRLDPDGTLDPNGDVLSSAWQLLSTPSASTAVLSEDADGRLTFIADMAGDYLAQVMVSDDTAASYDTVLITADQAAGVAPIARAGAAQTVSLDQPVTLDGSASTDADGDRLSYQWALISAPAGSAVMLTDVGAVRPQLTPDVAGEYVAQLIVSDGLNHSAPSTVTLSTVNNSTIALAGADDQIVDAAAIVNGSASFDADGDALSYRWSLLGLAAGAAEGSVAAADQASTAVSLPDRGLGMLNGSEVEQAAELLADYNLIVFQDLNSNVDTEGRVLVGGSLVGGSATFATGIVPANGIDVLSVVGDINGAPKNINNGGNVRAAGTVRSRLNFNGGGQLIADPDLSVDEEQLLLTALALDLQQLPANSSAEIPSGQPGPARLHAEPDNEGVAVLNLADGRDLFQNTKVQQIEVELNEAVLFIINVGGSNINFNQGNFVGAVQNDAVSSRLIWNFYEAEQINFHRSFEGTVLAPWAFLHNLSDIDGSVVVNSMREQGRVGLPGLAADGITTALTEATRYALMQLQTSDDSGLPPSFDTTVLTIDNVRPLAQAGAEQTGFLIEPVTLDGLSSSDVNGDALSYRWSLLSLPAGSQAQLDDSGLPNPTLLPDQRGLYVAQLVVSDGDLDSRPDTVVLDIINRAPVADAGNDQAIFVGETAQLDGLASSDADGDPLSYRWTLLSQPAGSSVSLSGPTSATPTLVPDVRGDYVIELIVNDGFTDSAPDQVTITAPNRAPQAQINGPAEAAVGDLITVDGAGSSDPDGDALSYLWTLSTPTGSQAQLADASAAVTSFTADVAGIYSVSLVVNDGLLDSAPASTSINVIGGNRPPILESVGNQTVVLGSSLSLDLNAMDPDGDLLRFFVTPLPLIEGAGFDATDGVFNFRPGSLDPASITLTFGVSDGVASDNETVTISVIDDPQSGITGFTGRVIDAVDGSTPVVGATVMIGDVSVLTDSDGVFFIDGIAVGTQLVMVLPDTATAAPDGLFYASTQFTIPLIENVTNRDFGDFLLPRLNGASAEVVAGSATVIDDSQRGLRVEIPADSIFDGADLYQGRVGLTALSSDQANQLPDGVFPCQLFAIEPKDLSLTRPITLTAGNPDLLPAGTVVDLWVFQNNAFSIVGSGQVSADASSINATADGINGGALIAFAPRRHLLAAAQEQATARFVPNFLADGSFATAYTLPGYQSIEAVRAASLVYQSNHVSPQPIITANADFSTTVVPQSVTTQVVVGQLDESFRNTVDTRQLNGNVLSQSAVVQAGNLPTGVYPYRLLSLARYACSVVSAELDEQVAVNNQRSSPFGAGWTLPELQQLGLAANGQPFIVEGNGVVSVFGEFAEEPYTEGFDDGFGGWQVINDVRSFRFVASGGNPGGYIEFVDAVQGQTVYWRAPQGLVDRLPQLSGGVIEFDLRQNRIDRQFVRTDEVVIETGDPDFTLAYDLPNNPGTAWTHYEVPLSVNPRWLVIDRNRNTLRPASSADFEQAIAAATLFRIRAEFRTGAEVGGLDNVRLRRPVLRPGDEDRTFIAAFEGDEGDFSRLFQNPDGTFSRLYPDGAELVFDAQGRQISATDRNGNKTEYKYDSAGRVTRITDPAGLVTQYNYLGNNLSSIIDPTGRETFFAYDSNGALIAITAPDGDLTQFKYDDNLRLIEQIDQRGISVQHRYGAAGRYIGSDLPDGSSVALQIAKSVGLDDLGTTDAPAQPIPPEDRISRVTDGRGNVTETEVNAAGQPIRSTDPLGRVTLFERNGDNLLTATVAPSGSTASRTVRTELIYDTSGNVLTQREAVGEPSQRQTLFEYEPNFSRVTQITDAAGQMTRFVYDDSGNLLRTIDARGGEEVNTYDSRGLLLSRQDQNGGLTRFEYDDFGRLIRTIGADGEVTRLILSDAGNVLIRINAEGSVDEQRETTAYDDENRITSRIDGNGAVTNFEYDVSGNLTRTIDASGLVETRQYDTLGRLQQVDDAQIGSIRQTNDANGNVVTEVDAAGNTVSYAYDAADRLERTVDATGAETRYTFDASDNVIAVTDATGAVTRYEYDALNRTTARITPLGNIWRFQYDVLDNRVVTIKPDGARIDLSYDALSRLTGLSSGTGATAINRRYTYDAVGNVTLAAEDGGGSGGVQLSFVYDIDNRLIRAETRNLFGDAGINAVLDYTYDALDRRTQLSDSLGGQTTYGYDAADRLQSLTTPAGDIFTQTYDGDGRLLSRSASNGNVSEWAYEPDSGRISRLSDRFAAGQQTESQYAYNLLGNITQISESGLTDRQADYQHTLLGRLSGVDVLNDSAANESYAYDPVGRRIGSHLSQLQRLNQASQLLENDQYLYQYDANGNLIERNAKIAGLSDWQYQYNALDQLIAVQRDGVVVEAYRYDALNRRSLIASTGLDPLGIIYDGERRHLDISNVNGLTLQRRYNHGLSDDQPLQLEVYDPAGLLQGRYQYHADHLGSIRYLSDDNGLVVNRYTYDAFGNRLHAIETVPQPFSFTGREWDELTQLYHFRARAYDAAIGRFLQEDPFGVFIADPNDPAFYQALSITPSENEDENIAADNLLNLNLLNLYSYVDGRPLIYQDTTGAIAGLSYSRLVAGARARVTAITKNINYVVRRALGKLPTKPSRGGNQQPFDPRNGRFLPNNANYGLGPKALSFLADCIGGAAPIPPDLSTGDPRVFALCFIAALLFQQFNQ
ncbi:MAG: hypothetical protein Tsb002_29360 [Wenzhouxiangellaceae bacterium]